MADKPGPFFVRPLGDFLGGVDPGQLTIKLLNAGYRGFYVRIPAAYQLRGAPTSVWALAAMPDLSMASMVELTEEQLFMLIDREHVELAHFPGAALYPERDASGVPTRRLIRQTHLSAKLAPIEGGRTDIGVEGSVRRQPIPGSSEYRYWLSVTYADLYVRECDLVANNSRELISPITTDSPQKDEVPDPSDQVATHPAVEGEVPEPSHQEATPPVVEDEVPDPFGLKTTSPVVYEIMKMAYGLRGVDFDATTVLSKLKEKDLGFEKNPHPFKNDQGKFAAQLVDRSYGMKQARPGMEASHLDFLEAAPQLGQDYYSPGMKKLLYAASAWSGKVDAGCQDDVEGVAKLLTKLGFRDGHDKTEVRYMLFFITKKKQPHPDEAKSKVARHRTKPGGSKRS